MKLNFKVAFPKEKKHLPLPKEVLSKGGFVKPAPDLVFTGEWLRIGHGGKLTDS